MRKDKKVAAAPSKNSNTAYQTFENWAAKNDSRIFYTLVILCLLLSFISFNARISEAHDDALYLEGGWRYVHEFPTYFYTQNAPLYPMFLAVLIKLIGFKLMIFKLFSILFNVLGFIFFYKALRGRLPAIVFIPVAIFQATNYLILYYASMTFTEAFYFFLQGLFFFYSVKIIDAVQLDGVNIKKHLTLWLMFGLSMFLMSTAKSAAIVVIPAVLLFFAMEKNWRAMAASLGAYLVFKIPYEGIVRTVWASKNQFAEQSKILLQKDPYDKSLGNEDGAGFIKRFIENCDLSLSKRFYQLLGLKEEMNHDTNGLLTLFTIVIAIIGFWQLYKSKNKAMVLFSIYIVAQLVLSFIILQVRWDQPRITLVCMQILLILMFYAFYILGNRVAGLGQTIYIVIVVIMIGSVCLSSLKRGFKNLPIVQKNLKGDKYYGYTPDWQNFLKCSEWCGDSLGKETLVASRKAPMSFVYAKGKKFFPVYSVIKKDTATNQSNPDSALAFFRKNHVTHVMMGNVRVNPTMPGAGIINTIQNILGPIAQKYPEKLKVVHIEGADESAYVYELVY